MPVRRKRPYNKKFVGRRSRPQKRARTDGRRRRTGSKTYSNSTMMLKCEATQINQFRIGWNAGEDLSTARQKINWDSLASITGDVISLLDSPDFAYWAPKFTTYEVKGVRMEYKPYKFEGGGYSAIAASPIASRDSFHASWTDYAEAINPVATKIYNYANAFNQADFKSYTHGRTIKKYISLTKYYKKRGMTRQHLYTANPTQDNLRPMATYFVDNMLGLVNNFDIGRYTVTYYVKFSGFVAI